MAKANRYFTRRGETEKEIDYMGKKIDIKISIPSNYEHDKLMDEFTEMGADKSINIRAPDLIEERLIRFIIELPFEVPVTEEMDQYKEWSEATHEERRIAIRLIDPDLRDEINNQMVVTSELSSEDVGN